MTVLIIEDDLTISDFLKKGFSEAGFTPDSATDGHTGLDLALQKDFDLLIVDLMLPGLDGLQLIGELRKVKAHVPILILSAKRSLGERIFGLDSGADDYLVKPFAFAELLARSHALLRRSSKKTESNLISVGQISLHIASREVFRENKKIDLQAKEFSLLEFFLRNPDRVVTKTQILEQIWNYNFDPQTNVVDVLVCRLRNKIDRDFAEKTIQTVRGVGYVLKST
jgi:two-component system OmpR family response regulator